jgi:hypothetical protein
MILWQITSYRTAVDTELAIRRATTLLRLRYGRRWRRCAPGDLVWMLRTGVGVDEACSRVTELTALAHVKKNGRARDSAAEGNADARLSSAVAAVAVPDTSTACVVPVTAPVDVPGVDQERLAAAIRLNREHWATTGRPVSAETLRKRLHMGAAPARALGKAVRATDQAAVCRTG